MQVVVDGLLTVYERHGKGKSLLLLHGWADKATSFQQLISGLTAQLDVIALNLPGFGGTDAPRETWDLSNYAQFVRDFLRKVDVEPYAILGHSNGGAIAIRGLSDGVLRADKLVLLASAGIRTEARGRKAALQAVVKTGKLFTKPLPPSVKKRLQQRVYTAVGSDMLVAEHLQETFKRVVGDDVQADAAKLSVPTLLIYGGKDEATPLRYGETFHKLIAGSKLEVLPGAGHFVHLDEPMVVLSKVKEFLR